MPPVRTSPYQSSEQRAAVMVNNNATQSIPNTTETTIVFQAEQYDTHGMHDTVTNNDRLTCIVPGLYQASASIAFAANATGQRFIQIYQWDSGGIPRKGFAQYAPGSAGMDNELSVTGLFRMVAGDYLNVMVVQTSGGALNVQQHLGAGRPHAEFGAVRIGA
jgi:hypothetical protein